MTHCRIDTKSMTYLITFLEGVITFISPCLLPLLPVYIAYFAGGVEGSTSSAQRVGASANAGAGVAASADGSTAAQPATRNLTHTIICALGFVVGFTILFCIMGAFAGSVGGFFAEHQAVLNVICGAVVVFFGLHFAGVLNIPALQKTLRPNANQKPRGFFSSMLFGVVFAIGWTPCVGAFLGSALALAASTGSTAEGVALLVCYSLGLGVPFLLTAVLIDQLEGAFSWIKRHYRVINTVCGVLLIVVGVLIATGQMGAWLSLLAG